MTDLELSALFAKMAVMTFGGGYAMVPIFENEIVRNHELMSSEDFSNLVGLAQVTPGPIGLNSATYVGMNCGGFSAMMAASLGVIVPSLLVSLAAAVWMRREADSKWMKLFLKGVRPCVVGIIASAVVYFARNSANVWQGAVIFALVTLVRWWRPQVNPAWLLIGSAALGWALFI